MSNTVNPGTFTRATEATYHDHEGLIRTAKSGQARMAGSRDVKNLITAAEDMTNGAWDVVDTGVTVDSATQVSWDGTDGADFGQTITIVDDGGGTGARTFVARVELSLASGTVSSDAALQVRLVGDALSGNFVSIGSEITSTAQVFSISASTDTAGTDVILQIRADDAITLNISKAQVEEVTGQTNQNPGEYVSTGVATGPELVVDPTFSDIATNWTATSGGTLSTPSTGTIRVTNGSFSSARPPAIPTVVGKQYVISADMVTLSGAVNGRIQVSNNADGTGATLIKGSLQAGDTGRGIFTATATTTYLYLNTNSATAGHYTEWQNPSFREADHGLNRDGVKAFSTLNGNTKEIRKFLDLDGTGDYASTPNPPQLLASDFRIDADIRFDAYSNGVTDNVIGHLADTSRRGWVLSMRGTGKILFSSSPDGTSGAQVAFESALHGLTDGARYTISAVYDHSAGAMSFYIDGVLLSTDSGGALTGIYYEETDPVAIGAIFGGTGDDTPGQVFSVQVRQSTDVAASPIIDFNAEDHTGGSTLTSSTTGEVWTFNADAFIDYEETGVVTEATGPAVSKGQWIELDGASGTYVSTPDNGAFPTESHVLGGYAMLRDWTPSDSALLIGKWTTSGNQRSVVLNLHPNGTLQWVSSSDGLNVADNPESTVTHGFANGTGHWVFAIWDSDADEVTFWVSDQPSGTSLSDLNLVQLGAAVSTTATAIYDSTAEITVGAFDSGADNLLDGFVARAVVIDSTDPTATPVVDFNANDYEAGKTWETQSQVSSPNLITNGTFDSDLSGWSAGTDWSVVSGKAVDSGSNTTVSARKLVWEAPLTAGKRYRYSFEISDVSGGNPSFSLSSDLSLTGTTTIQTTSGDGTYTGTFTATSTREYVAFSGALATFKLDNVSVIELPDIWTLNGAAKAFSPLARWGDLPGSSSDDFSTPDSAALDITSDISLEAWAAPDDWVPAATDYLIGKYGSVGQRSYGLSIRTSGALGIFLSDDGSTTTLYQSTVATNFSDGVMYGVRVDVDFTNNEVKFYTTEDRPQTPASEVTWTQLGETVTLTIASIAASTATVRVGSLDSTNNNIAGKIAVARIYGGYGDSRTLKAEFDARTFTPGVSTATAPTGETWTANGNVTIEQNIPSTWDSDGPLGYLAEEARTNIALHSQDLSSTWVNVRSVDSQNYAIAPDGTKTANRLLDNSATGTNSVHIDQTVTVSSGNNTMSAYLKAGQLDWAVLQHFGFDDDGGTYFDLSNGVVGTVSGNHSDVGMEYVGNGWYRCWIVMSSTTDLSGDFEIYVAEADNDTIVDLDGTSSILIWGAQVEAGAFPTSYQPTTTASVARNADVLTYSTTGAADSFPMTMSAEAAPHQFDTAGYVVSVDSGGGANNRFQTNVTTGANPRTFVRVTGTEADITGSSGFVRGVPSNIAAAAAADDVELYFEGVSDGTPDTSANMPSGQDTIGIGINHADSFHLNGTVRKVKIFNKRLNDSQIENL